MSRPGMACRDSATGTIVLTCGDRVLGNAHDLAALGAYTAEGRTTNELCSDIVCLMSTSDLCSVHCPQCLKALLLCH